MKNDNFEKGEDIIAGRNPVSEALKSGRSIERILVAHGEMSGSVKVIVAKAKEKGVNFLIPQDNVVATEYKADAEFKPVDSDNIPDGWMGLDIGEKTAKLFADAIKNAGTVVWNGPMGVSEWPNFAKGTIAVAKAVAESDAISIIGGGDSTAAVENLGFADKMTHISTGGGASLEFLEGKVLPGIACLNDKD